MPRSGLRTRKLDPAYATRARLPVPGHPDARGVSTECSLPMDDIEQERRPSQRVVVEADEESGAREGPAAFQMPSAVTTTAATATSSHMLRDLHTRPFRLLVRIRPRGSHRQTRDRTQLGTRDAEHPPTIRLECREQEPAQTRIVELFAPVAQWIEQRFPKPRAQVQFLSGASSLFARRLAVIVPQIGRLQSQPRCSVAHRSGPPQTLSPRWRSRALRSSVSTGRDGGDL